MPHAKNMILIILNRDYILEHIMKIGWKNFFAQNLRKKTIKLNFTTKVVWCAEIFLEMGQI